MFSGASAFNQPLEQWNVGNVTNMRNMFARASAFNQPIGNWDVSQVTTMNGMFADASAFNQDIGQWNVSQVTDMNEMFYNAKEFNQNISHWMILESPKMKKMFDHSGYTYAEPTLERANERMKNRRNLRHAERQAIKGNSEWYKNNPQGRKVLSTKKEHGPGPAFIEEFLGGKSKRKTHKRKYKSKKKNITRKRKQSKKNKKKSK